MELGPSQAFALCSTVAEAIAARIESDDGRLPSLGEIAGTLRGALSLGLDTAAPTLALGHSAREQDDAGAAGADFLLVRRLEPGRAEAFLSVRVCASETPEPAVLPAVAHLAGRGSAKPGLQAFLMFLLLGPSKSALERTQHRLLGEAARPHLFTRHLGGWLVEGAPVASHLFELDLST